MKTLTLIASVLLLAQPGFAVQPDRKDLPIGFAEFESFPNVRSEKAGQKTLPNGARALAEWEPSAEVMTLWTNPGLVRELAKRNKVRLFADSQPEVGWWENWLEDNDIPDQNIRFHVVNTDSMWVRDYGPWYIYDKDGNLGLVDTIYNRPRPNDDKVPSFISRAMNVPLFDTGIVHTGGNYYTDSLGNAFSSTLVYSENPEHSQTEILAIMKNFLGINRYLTGRLNPGITIEHLDTYGKLVAPDTWVYGAFPENSPYHADSEKYAEVLAHTQSPYGHPYHVFRLPMSRVPGGTDYRAYINSFMSNDALYMAAYGDEIDDEAARIYAQALPGYEIVKVPAMNTRWGDSVHCRTRNFPDTKEPFLAPRIERHGDQISIKATGYRLASVPVIHWSEGGSGKSPLLMQEEGDHEYSATLPLQEHNAAIRLYFDLTGVSGKTFHFPRMAPEQEIELTF